MFESILPERKEKVLFILCLCFPFHYARTVHGFMLFISVLPVSMNLKCGFKDGKESFPGMEVLPALNLDMREQLSSDDGVYKFFHPMNY